MKKTNYMATLYNGHCHIERRVWLDKEGFRAVKINGMVFRLIDLKHLDVNVWLEV